MCADNGGPFGPVRVRLFTLLPMLTSSFRLVNPDSVGQHLHQVVGGVRNFRLLIHDVGLTAAPYPTEQLRLQHARRL